MKNISKYLLLVFLFENLCTQTVLLYQYTQPVFYGMLGIGVLTLARSSNWSSISMGRFGWMFFLSFIYVFHCFIVGREFFNQEILIYLITKIVTFFIIMTSLNEDLDFYEGKGLIWFALGVFVLQVFMLSGSKLVFDGEERITFGYVNSNAMGGISTIVFGILLCKYKEPKKPKWALALCCLAAFGTMVSGSRSSIVVLVMMYILLCGMSIKTFVFAGIAALMLLVVLPDAGIEVAGINRMKETISGELGDNRGDERLAAKMMIEDRPWTGWGLKTENQGRAAIITMMSSHNSYMDLAKTMGIPLAIIWILTVASVIIRYLTNMRRYSLPFDFFIVYAICIMIKGLYEAMFAGVHDIQTNMLYVSLAVLSMRLYNAKVCR